MAQNKRKKLSLDEARAMFSDGPAAPARSNASSKAKGNAPFKPNRKPSANSSQIQQKIAQLERKVMEGDLSAEEEAKVLAEIGFLEKKIK